MNALSPYFTFLFGVLTVAMLFLWAVRNNELFQVAIWSWHGLDCEEKRWVGESQAAVCHGGLKEEEEKGKKDTEEENRTGNKGRERRKK